MPAALTSSSLIGGLQAMDGDWLTALLEFSQQSPIGAVGAKLHHSDGSLKRIGILFGVNGERRPHSSGTRDPPWGTGEQRLPRNYSAVSGECLMTRLAVYDEVGGFDDEMGGFADVDYCLRVTAAGYLVVFTPHAPLITTTRRAGVPGPTRATRAGCESDGATAVIRDPFYDSTLSRDSPDYEPDLSVHADGGRGN